jgi:NhaP-type Na+/H+ or K+/H+ antiporter
MLGMAWLPTVTKRIKVSYSIIYVLFGMLLYSIVPSLPSPNPFDYLDFTVHITELVVIISLMGSGLKIDEPFSFRSWRTPFRLASISMILNILIVALLGYYILNYHSPPPCFWQLRWRPLIPSWLVMYRSVRRWRKAKVM